jgi:hypothetical protein
MRDKGVYNIQAGSLLVSITMDYEDGVTPHAFAPITAKRDTPLPPLS